LDKRVPFGKTGLEVSPICFGTWQLSPRFWGDISKEAAMDAMRTAYDSGINFYDTADAYGDGYGESVLGEFVSGLKRENVVITTKVFNHFNPDGSRYPDLSGDHIRERCELQLKRLGTDYIDIYLLHFFDQLTPVAKVAETMKSLQKEGKIRHFGVSNHTVEQLRATRAFADYSVVQPLYNLFSTGIENDLLPYCQAENLGVMVFSPMHKGLLTGKYDGSETFTDFRKYHPDFQGERFRKIAGAIRSLQGMADGYNVSLYQLVMAATLMHPAIQVAIAGIKTPDQIREAVGSLQAGISRPDYFAIRKALAVGGPGKMKDATGTVK
jgi:aryl-alcohol dehydrogenase-like predicted oxidoreductase